MIIPTERVDKRWGFEDIIVNDEDANYCGKIMCMKVGVASRVERHGRKDETFYVLDGAVKLEIFGDGDEPDDPGWYTILYPLGPGFRIRPGTWHRFSAHLPETRFIEFSTYHFDGDTQRAELK